MPDELRLVGSLALSFAAVLVLVPLAIRVAFRTRFLDVPAGYKGHARPTPYLGGAAVIAAFGLAGLAFGGAGYRFEVIAGCALLLFVVGTIDDRVNLGPSLRVAVEVAAAGALWAFGLGWSVFGSDIPDVLLTIVWVVAIVNAFNLMDNMDGSASTVAAVSAGGVATFAAVEGDFVLAALVLGLAGACAGFLRFNLARPSRIFLGDGGSMPVGFVLAAAVMAVPVEADIGWAALFAAAPLVALPILDTTLVVVSRIRRGVQVLSGGRDHLTHRIHARVGSARVVALFLAGAQVALCAAAVSLSQAGRGWVMAEVATLVLAGAVAIYLLEVPRRAPAAAATTGPQPVPVVVPEQSAA